MSLGTMPSSKAEVTRLCGGFTIALPFPPVPASRPRVTRWGTYYGKTYKNYRELADKAIPQSDITLEGNLCAHIEFVCAKPKTVTDRVKRDNPRGDIDNHMKAVLDAITGTSKNPKNYWNDDDQIVRVTAVKRYAKFDEEPYTFITVTET